METALAAHLRCKVPDNVSGELVDALQRLMLEAVQLCGSTRAAGLNSSAATQLARVRCVLEYALTLLERVSSLGPLEVFFAGDELVCLYARAAGAANALCAELASVRCSRVGSPPAAPLGQLQLQLPQQQAYILHAFKVEVSCNAVSQSANSCACPLAAPLFPALQYIAYTEGCVSAYTQAVFLRPLAGAAVVPSAVSNSTAAASSAGATACWVDHGQRSRVPVGRRLALRVGVNDAPSRTAQGVAGTPPGASLGLAGNTAQ